VRVKPDPLSHGNFFSTAFGPKVEEMNIGLVG